MNNEEDRLIVNRLIANDPIMIEEFLFVRCRTVLAYIGQYFCGSKETPESLIGEFYEYLSDKDWHKLRIFKYSCSLNAYISVIATRYFQNRRDSKLFFYGYEPLPIKENSTEAVDCFTQEDICRLVSNMKTLDRFLIERILLDGEKISNIVDEAKHLMDEDHVNSMNEKQVFGYLYTRYARAKQKLQKQLISLGYGA